MNRQQRRAAKRSKDAVLLRGGPMDGWYVAPGAAALREDWHKFWPETIAAKWEPGRYVRKGQDDDGIEIAIWEELS